MTSTPTLFSEGKEVTTSSDKLEKVSSGQQGDGFSKTKMLITLKTDVLFYNLTLIYIKNVSSLH